MNNFISPSIHMKLHHIAIQVKNLKTSLEFYQTLFGLQIERHFYLEEEEIFWLQGHGWRLELITTNQESKLENTSPSSASYHFAIEVPNLTKWEQICYQLQIKVIEGPLTLADGTQILFIEGPDSEQIEFIESVP